jgi:guanosine-3',5'-bis(diphosphate) 3'-pyrophosphohydrolase
MLKSSLPSLAQDFATLAHEGQSVITSDDRVRYKITHVQEVADLVWASGGTDTEISAAWLHDTIEDTSTTLEDIEKAFGTEVRDIVEWLTDTKEIIALPLPERKQAQADKMKSAPESVRRIKLADQTSNVRFLAITSKKNITDEQCRKYTEGAKLIVDQCRGTNPLLEKLFDEAYRLGFKRYIEAQ